MRLYPQINNKVCGIHQYLFFSFLLFLLLILVLQNSQPTLFSSLILQYKPPHPRIPPLIPSPRLGSLSPPVSSPLAKWVSNLSAYEKH